MISKRVYPDEDGGFYLNPGEYLLNKDGTWYAETPTGLLAWLKNHQVIENEDGTISVTPSILVTGETTWHGYLTKGIWKEC
jgi:hypothetical protein